MYLQRKKNGWKNERSDRKAWKTKNIGMQLQNKQNVSSTDERDWQS